MCHSNPEQGLIYQRPLTCSRTPWKRARILLKSENLPKMGQIHTQASHTKIMPELLVFQDNRVLLVKGVEGERVFWWPPGAYWVCEKTCDLQVEDPKLWIKRVLNDQVGLDLLNASLRSINIVAPNHEPVFVYQVDVEGDPKPNQSRGFQETAFFESQHLPQVLGRDDKHGSWLHKLLHDYWTR
jgi:hypothetical protein